MFCGLKALSEIEQLKFIKSLSTGFSSTSLFFNFIYSNKLYFGEWEEFKRRMYGLFAEDNFELLCVLSERFTFISSLSQSKKLDTNLGSAPDFLAVYINKNHPYKVFFEVKIETKVALRKPSHSLKNINIDKVLETSLYVASRIERGHRGTWLIHSRDDFVRLGRAGLADAFEQSVNNHILGDKAIEIRCDFTLRLNYSLMEGEVVIGGLTTLIDRSCFVATAAISRFAEHFDDGDFVQFKFKRQVLLLSEICLEMNMMLNNQHQQGINSERLMLLTAVDSPGKVDARKYGFSATLSFIKVLADVGVPIDVLDW